MTTPSLPAGLGAKLLSTNYTAGAPDGVDRTEVEGGAARQGLAWDRGMQPFQVSLQLSDLEFSVWNTFYFHKIKKGALSFTMPLDSGYGISDHLVTMLPGTYSAPRLRSPKYVVSFVVETENQAYLLDAADADALLDLYEVYGPGSAELLARLAQFALVDTLVLDI
jgi:hypothetical protein